MHVLGNAIMNLENISDLQIKKGLLGNKYLEITYYNRELNNIDSGNKIKLRIYNLQNIELFVKKLKDEIR